MSLELKLQENRNGENKFQLPGGDLQGFVCFTWTSAFHKYVDYCNLIKIQVILEGYLVTNPSNKLSTGKKFYTSEILCIRGIYGEKRLGELFPKRSFAFPFMVRPNHPQHMMPSCRSAKMLNVAYRLKTRVTLRDHGQQRSPDAAYTCFSHQLPFNMTPGSTPNQATLEAIQRVRRTVETDGENHVNKVLTSNDTFQIRASLSNPVASAQSPGAIEVLVRLDQIHDSAKPVSKIIGKLIQECTIEEGVTVRKKAKLFNIRLDVGERRDRKCEELSIPFNLPSGLLPTLIEKDRSAKVSYRIQVGAHVGKKEECFVTLPLIVVPH
ncbi:uncharacterized protein LOC116929704 [Daphnia magna]|uniref:Arrestin C-terminal-like domain-containing protein n=1 Tax=Daphnia magna TaxID=35525 RepID=A0ABQ9YQ26_9CRUS|nr:uncharacterized protein LOC116929704 [Daphnia magna]KAK4002706.1 hypothetical protein OUZ56_004513 [Daphnia magna]